MTPHPLEPLLRRLGATFTMIELIALIFGEYLADVGTPVNESWNAETARRLTTRLRYELGCEQLDSISATDDKGHWTTTSRWRNPFAMAVAAVV